MTSPLPALVVHMTVADLRELVAQEVSAASLDRPMTTAEAAAFFQTSESTVLRWVRAGVIPGKKLAGEYRFLRSELLATCRIPTTDTAGHGVQQTGRKTG